MTEPDFEQLDPVTLEILWSRLISVTNEQAAALMRTSFTPIVREVGDLSAAVFDSAGRMVAQSVTGTPGHVNGLATGLRHLLDRYPPDVLAPGDVLVTNDPWATTGQLNDISVVTPVFRDGGLIAFFGNCCHAMDIGGLGLSTSGREVYEEGLQIPTMKLRAGGEVNDDLVRLIAANVRTPREVLGDLDAQVVANQVGSDTLLRYLDDLGLDDFDALARQVVDHTEAVTRRAIAAVPDGEYRNECLAEGIGEAIEVSVRVAVRGDELLVDFEGSSPQVSRGLNVVLNYARAYANYAVKCLLCPEVPHNEGSFRPVTVQAPEGCVFNPTFPHPVAGRHIVGHAIPDAVFGALAPAVGGRAMAEGARAVWLATVRGAGRQRFVSVLFAAGGMGARGSSDGLSATAFPSGVATAPVEVVETSSPLVVTRKELRTDSGGAGRYRGGLGQTVEVGVRTGEPYVVSVLSDRLVTPASGFDGGLPGAPGGFRASVGGEVDPRAGVALPAGATFTLELPGGGGQGSPGLRDKQRLASDVDDGFVSRDAAASVYGHP